MTTMNDESPKPRNRERVIGCLLAVPILILLFGVGMVRLQQYLFQKKLEAVYGSQTLTAFYGQSGHNEVALEIERLGAELGIHIWPSNPRFEPTDERNESFREVVSALNAHDQERAALAEAVRTRPPTEVLDYLSENREILRQIIALLLGPEKPSWELYARGSLAPPNVLGFLYLNRLIALEASERTIAGDHAGATEALEAAWNLQQALLDHPSLVSNMVALSAFRSMQPVVRSLCPPSEHWQHRLAEIDLMSSTYRALHAIDWTLMLRSRDWFGQDLGVLRRPYAWLAGAECSYRHYRYIAKLRGQNPKELEPEVFYAENRARKMGLTPCAMLLTSDTEAEAWSRAHRTQLIAELSALVLEERRRRLTGEVSVASSSRPSRVEGLNWTYEPRPEGLEIRLDGDLPIRQRSPYLPEFQALRFLIRAPAVEGCASAE